jgi:hypothetical protein
MIKLFTILSFGAVAAALAYASYQTTRWGGSYGFSQLEYEFTFNDSRGDSIEGIELRVEDQRGKEFYCFPVTDYLPNQVPKSDKDGVMRFHHVSTAVEWDNYGWYLFWLFPIQTTRSPVYVCRFLRAGKEVYRVPFGELPEWDWPGRMWEEVPRVKRQWNWSAMIPNEIRYKAEESEESYDSRLRLFFHHDRDERPNREVSVACLNATRLLFNLERPHASKQEAVEAVEFPVIRRTIVVELPADGE